jgi:hypothetical protein
VLALMLRAYREDTMRVSLFLFVYSPLFFANCEGLPRVAEEEEAFAAAAKIEVPGLFMSVKSP